MRKQATLERVSHNHYASKKFTPSYLSVCLLSFAGNFCHPPSRVPVSEIGRNANRKTFISIPTASGILRPTGYGRKWHINTHTHPKSSDKNHPHTTRTKIRKSIEILGRVGKETFRNQHPASFCKGATKRSIPAIILCVVWCTRWWWRWTAERANIENDDDEARQGSLGAKLVNSVEKGGLQERRYMAAL